jgi:hypothetical protein
MQINLIVYHKICIHSRVEDWFVFISMVLKFYLLSASKLCVSVLRQKDGASLIASQQRVSSNTS